MSKFNKKATRSSSTGSNVDWEAFNEHLLEQIGEEEENRVAIVSGLIDLGVQERPDFVEEYVGNKKQEKALEEGRSYLRENDDGEEEIVTELKPVDQIAIFADFPEIMVNYGKYFSADGEDDWKPYRHLITGEYWNKAEHKMFAKGVSLSCQPNDKAKGGWAYDAKSTISKLATATGVSRAPVEQDFDLGELLGGVFSMDLVAEESKDGKHVNVKARNPSKKHPAVKVPEYDIEPMGIMFDGDNDLEDVKQLRTSLLNTLEAAKGWETSGLKEQVEEVRKQSSNEGKKDKDKDEKDTSSDNQMPDLDSMEDEDILDLAEDLGMRVTSRTKVSRAISFIEDHYEGNDEEDEEPPKKRSVSRSKSTSKKSNTKAKEEEESDSEDDTDDEAPPF